MIKEIFLLRSVACLSIVFLHSIGIGLYAIDNLTTKLILDSIHMLLYYGTPMFVFISILILAYSYRNRELPSTFFNKRLKYIFIPYVAMALFYSIPYATSPSEWGVKFLLNALIGDFHGYFVLIIFQFYLFFWLTHGYLKRSNPYILLSLTLIINLAYLAFFTFVHPWSIPFSEYIWNRFYWVPMLGWVFYFMLGYYCGVYYEKIIMKLKKYKRAIWFTPILSSFIVLFLYHSEWITVHSSKRIDMLLHTTLVSLFLLYVANQLRSIPSTIVKISQYSFGIYLLHMFYISIIDFINQSFSFMVGSTYILFLFSFSTIASIVTVQLINKWRLGDYIVGKIGRDIKEKTPSKRNVA